MDSLTITQTCRDCSHQPGEGMVTDGSLRAAMNEYRDIAFRHATDNHGHRVETFIDGVSKSLMVFHGILPADVVKCDQCQGAFPKANAISWEDLTLCPGCAGLEPCRCGHLRHDHLPGGDECERCACSKYEGQ